MGRDSTGLPAHKNFWYDLTRQSRSLGTAFGAPEITTTVAADHNIVMQISKTHIPFEAFNFLRSLKIILLIPSGDLDCNFSIFLKEIRRILCVVASRVGNYEPRKNSQPIELPGFLQGRQALEILS